MVQPDWHIVYQGLGQPIRRKACLINQNNFNQRLQMAEVLKHTATDGHCVNQRLRQNARRKGMPYQFTKLVTKQFQHLRYCQ